MPRPSGSDGAAQTQATISSMQKSKQSNLKSMENSLVFRGWNKCCNLTRISLLNSLMPPVSVLQPHLP